MKVEACEICGGKRSEHICSRCHRLVCSDCYQTQLDLCVDCHRIKEAVRKDYLIQLKKYRLISNVIFDKMKNKDCFNCILLREVLLSALAHLRKMAALLRVEGYPDAEMEANKLYKELEKIAIFYISNLILKLKKK